MPSISQKRIVATAIPGPKSKALHERRQKAVSPGVFSLAPVYIESGSGSILRDVDGNQIIDLGCGIGVTTLGHSLPQIAEAVANQSQTLCHTLFATTPYEPYVRVCEELAKHTPGDFPKKSLLLNAGAEAIENAIKIARVYTKKRGVAVLDYSFHGRTNLTISMSYKGSLYGRGFGPYASDIYSVPNSYPLKDGLSGPEAAARTIEVLKTRVAPEDLACLVFEPVQGEGGFIYPAEGFLPRLQEWCSANGVLFIADEIQSGYGRTGRFYACEWEKLVPDMVCSAKGIANGLPLSAVTGRAEIMDAAAPATLGGTFGGNPVSCSAALAVFEKHRQEDLLAKALKVEEVLGSGLKKLQKKYPQIAEVRGRGAMLAIEFLDPKTREPLGDLVTKLVLGAANRGVFLIPAGIRGNVIRFLPAITIEPQLLEDALEVLDQTLAEIAEV